jgi:hypothetical protein
MERGLARFWLIRHVHLHGERAGVWLQTHGGRSPPYNLPEHCLDAINERTGFSRFMVGGAHPTIWVYHSQARVET